MASSAILPSLSLPKISSDPFRSSITITTTNFSGFNNGFRSLNCKKLKESKFIMSVAAGSRVSVADDSLFLDYKPSTAFLFPGQGAQVVGMGTEAQKVQAAAELYEKANEILGFNLLDVCLNGPKEKLDSTVISQPAIYVTSLAAVELLRARDGGQQIIDSVDVTCGLSLGEYTALAFAGAFRFQVQIWNQKRHKHSGRRSLQEQIKGEIPSRFHIRKHRKHLKGEICIKDLQRSL